MHSVEYISKKNAEFESSANNILFPL